MSANTPFVRNVNSQSQGPIIRQLSFYPRSEPNTDIIVDAYGVPRDTPVRLLVEQGGGIDNFRQVEGGGSSLNPPDFEPTNSGVPIEPDSRNGDFIGFSTTIDPTFRYIRFTPVIGNPPNQIYGQSQFFTPQDSKVLEQGCTRCRIGVPGYVTPFPELQKR